VGDPTGEPRRLKPVVSSAGIGGANWSDLLGWREYFVMVLYMEAARVGFRLERVLSGEWPDVKVNMPSRSSLRVESDGSGGYSSN
jgi:hypothetical protein